MSAGPRRGARSWGLIAAMALAASGSLAAPAVAEVRFGNNVRVGGHDFSNQTFNAKRRGRIYLYERKPRREGCVWKADGRGGRVRVCHLQRVR